MKLELDFTVDFDDLVDEFAPLPDGKYSATVTDVQVSDDRVIVFTLDLEGNGRTGKFWDRFRVYHAKEEVANLHRKFLGKACKALGFDAIPDDTDDIIGKECEVVLKTKGDFQNVQRYIATKTTKPAVAVPPKPKTKTKSGPKTAPKAVKPTASAELDDDIPF